MNRRRRAALRSAERDELVFPLHGIRDGQCTCGNPYCESAGKHPRTAGGFKDATCDAEQIREWWKQWPDANVGIVTGTASGFVALDVDPRHEGNESLEQLELEFGKLPNGPCVRTGGGGEHRLFSHPGFAVNSKIGLRPGLDFKGDGAYVVGVGSNHVSGRRYLWEYRKKPSDIALPPIPSWLLELLRDQKPAATQFEKSIPEGFRNTTLASLGGVMRRRGASPQAIEAALLEDNSLRCHPPLEDVEVRSIARSIGRYAPGDDGILSASSRNVEQAERKLKFRTGKQIAEETPIDVPWIVPRWVVAGGITEIDGKIKLGKTTFITDMVYCVLNGLPFLGQTTSRTKVIYLTEQHIVSFRAAMKRANLLGYKDFSVLSWTDTLGIPWPSVVSATIDECKKRKAALLIIDTLGQFSGLAGDSENNAGDALKALRPLQQAAKENIAVIIVRHERKSGGTVGDSGRGSSAFSGAADIVMSVRRPEGNQAASVRLIQTLSRFDAQADLLVELTPEGYRALGAPGEESKKRAADDVLSVIPRSKKNAITIDDLAKATGKKRAHLQALLDVLAETKKISKLGKGRKRNPYRYFRL